MKFLLYVLALFAALHYVACYVPDKESKQHDNTYKKDLGIAIQRRLPMEAIKSNINSICSGYKDKFQNATDEVIACFEQYDLSEVTLCSILINHFQRCFKPLTNMFKECLPTEAKQLPELAVDMLVATSDHLCKSDGEHLFEFSNPCIITDKFTIKQCFQPTIVILDEYHKNQTLPSASEVCENFESLKPCLLSYLNASCRHPTTKESYINLFNVVVKVCRKYKSNTIDGKVDTSEN